MFIYMRSKETIYSSYTMLIDFLTKMDKNLIRFYFTI